MAPTSNTIAVRVAVQDAEKALQALRQLGEGGQAEFERLTAGASRANAALQQLSSGSGQNAGGIRQFGAFAQQAGFQVGDFAVQVAGGTNAIVAFGQQGSQLLGFFGPFGAAAGAAVAVISALAGGFLRAGDAAETAAGKFDVFAEATKRAAEQTRQAREEFARQQNEALPVFTGGKLIEQNIDDLEAQIKAIDQAEKLLQESIQRRRLGADDNRPTARDTFGGIGESERNIRRKQLEDEKKAAEELARETERLAKQRVTEAEAAARQAKQREQTIKAAEFEADAAKRIADANEISVEKRKEVEAQIDAERRTLQASATLQGEELERIAAANAARAEQEQRILATNEARKVENERIAEYNRLFEQAEREAEQAQRGAEEDSRREAERVAQQQADILAQPYKDLAGEISGIVADGINQALTDPDNFDFSTVADTFSDAMAAAVSGTLGNALTSSLNEFIVDFGRQLGSSAGGAGGAGGLANLGRSANDGKGLTLGQIGIGYGTAGYLGGSIYGQVAGLKPGNQAGLGGAIGGGLGAVAGSFFGPAGTIIGGTLGAAAGSAIGGLFGGENNLGNDRSAQTFNSRRGIIYSDKSFSPENRNITAGIANEVQTLIDIFGDLGGSVAAFNLRLEAGNKSGITVNGKKYATAADAITGAIEQLIGKTTNLSATQQTVLANTKGGSAQQVAADLAFGEQYDRLVFQGREVDLVLQDLNRTFASAGRQAAELGLNVDALAQAHQRAAEEVVAEFQARQQAANIQIETLARGNGGTIDLQFAQLELSMQALAQEAEALGLSLDRVTAAHQAQAAALVFQVEQQQRNIYAQLAVARGDDGLATQLFILETQFRDLAVAAQQAGVPLELVAEAQQRAAANLEAEFRAREQAERDAERARREAEAEQRRQRQQQATNLRNQLQQLAGGNTLGTALDALRAQFDDFRAQARDLGVSLALVNRAYEAQAQALREQYALQAQQLRLQLRGVIEGNTLGVQLAEIAIQFAELRTRAKELGVPLKLVAEAEAAAAKAARERAAAEKASFALQLARIGGERGLSIELAALNLEMKDAIAKARELGIPVKDVADAYKRAADALREEQRQKAVSLRLQLRQIAGEKSVSLELALLDERFEDLRKQAEELGVPLDLVTKAHRAAADAIIQAQKDLIKSTEEQQSSIERQLRDQVRGVQGLFDDLISPLKDAIANDNRLSPLAQINQAQSRFRETAALARRGDVEAIRNLSGDAGSLRDLASRFLGSGEQGSRIAREIDAALRATVGTLEQQRTETLASLPQVTRETTSELIREAKKDTASIIEALEKVRKELAALKRAA